MTGQQTRQQLERELAGLRLTHHGQAAAERRTLAQIAEILRRLRRPQVSAPPQHVAIGSPYIPDVSEFQPNIDWPTVARDGTTRAIAKATQYRLDHQFGRNWLGMERAGFVARGAYHYFTEEPGKTQAARLLEAVNSFGGLKRPFGWDAKHGPLGDFLAVDFEEAYADVKTTRFELSELVAELQAHAGRTRVLLYTGGPFWNAATGAWQNDLGCIIWHSAYVLGDPAAFYPACLHRALPHLWQYTNGKAGRRPHTIPGLGACDISVAMPGA